MTAGQRRMLWFCTFAMSFIFFYEASGKPLVHDTNTPHLMDADAAWMHFAQHIGIGGVFLVLGSALSIILQRRNEDESPALKFADWAGLAAGTGVLVATLWLSYQSATG